MNYRMKIYYPDSQVEKNLYTTGKEWMILDDWKEYNGFYHRYITGEVFSEKEWDPNNSKRLVKYRRKSEDYFKYMDLKKFKKINNEKVEIIGNSSVNFLRYRAPRVVNVKTKDSDLLDGVMTRYFIYKRNEPDRIFFEIDEQQSKLHKKPSGGINKNLYGLIEFSWKLTGSEYDVYAGGLLKEPGVVDTNKRIILRMSKKFRKLAEIVTDFRKYTVYA